jgi:hypothetical protein
MIRANLRERVTPADIRLAAGLLAGEGKGRDSEYYTAMAEAEGVDRVLSLPELLPLLLATPTLDAPSAPLLLYVTIRNALREFQVDDAELADYLGALLLEFGMRDRANRVEAHDDDRRTHLVDLVADLRMAEGQRAFLLCAHIGNYSLWLAGCFPDYITARNIRRGAPGFPYYDELGARGFRMAADHGLAREMELDQVYAHASELFGRLRVALNRVSDRMFFPGVSSPDRLMRQVREEFRLSA